MSVVLEVYRSKPSRSLALLRWVRLALLAAIAVVVLRWGLWDAVFVAVTPDACKAAGGACWAVITSQWKLVLLGTYPVADIWRPAVATVVLSAAFALPAIWPHLRILAIAWCAAAMVAIALLNGRYLGLPPVETQNWGGLPLTLLMSMVVMLASFPIALVVAFARLSDSVLLRSVSLVAVECIRGVPLVSLLFFAALILPLFFSGLSHMDKLTAATIAITIFNAAYISEVIRGGILTVPGGQTEAARSLGLRWARIQRLVILPQAFKACGPALVNHGVGIVKDTSLVAVLGILDFMNSAKLSLVDMRWREYFVETYIVVGVSYFLMCSAVAFIGRRLSSRLDMRSIPREDDASPVVQVPVVSGG